MISAVMSGGSWVVLGASLSLYAVLDYRSPFTIRFYDFSAMQRVRLPAYIEYMREVMEKRPELAVRVYPINYTGP